MKEWEIVIGVPVSYVRRSEFLPFTRPMVGEEEIAEIIDTIHSGWITTGPKSAKFEEALKAYNGVPHCLVMNSATTTFLLVILSSRKLIKAAATAPVPHARVSSSTPRSKVRMESES